MGMFTHKGKTYEVGEEGFLINPGQWDENFAEGAAPLVQITNTLTPQHWMVIRYIRTVFINEGRCALVYETCRGNKLHLSDLQRLFPTGYQRGACRLAGITYREGYLGDAWLSAEDRQKLAPLEKVYRVDVRGFLIDPSEWDEAFAVAKAFEMKVPGKLGERQWNIIRFLRERFL